jgi:hypothetical protein
MSMKEANTGGSVMTQITLDAAIARQLSSIYQSVELCDPSGRVLGHFVPRIDMSEWEPISPEISEEELEHRSKSTEKRYTTAEVLAHLEKLRCSESNGSK